MYIDKIGGPIMRRFKKKNKVMIVLIALLVVSIGYAAISTTLKITGIAAVTKQTWNIYWENPVVTSGSVTTTVPELVNNDTVATWDVTLNWPGEFYEFTIDAVNAGTIDAKIKDLSATSTPALPSYITYTVTDSNGDPLELNHTLAKANNGTPTKETYTVRVEFDPNTSDETIASMPAATTYEYKFKIKYGQANYTPSQGAPEPDDSDEFGVQAKIAAVEANPEANRNPNQDPSNEDIGIDERARIVNLDKWSYELEWEENPIKDYEILFDDNTYEPTGVRLGNCDGYVTMATASETIVNGKYTITIPEYIYLAEYSKTVPVVGLKCYFSSLNDDSKQRDHITQLPTLPKTITTYDASLFSRINTFTNITIPKHIKTIDWSAFWEAFDQSKNNTLSFEDGSELEYIGDSAFSWNNLTGNMTLPSHVNYIANGAFEHNNITSIRIPSGARYFVHEEMTEYSDHRIYNTFDDETEVIQY
jgi:hypothetical protein